VREWVPLLLAGSAFIAVALSPVSSRIETNSAVRAAVHAVPARNRNDRIYLNHDQLAQAYAAGLIDRPIRSILNVPHRLAYGEFVWNDDGVPAGPVWVRVDLATQLISVFRAGDEIGTAVVLYGAAKKETPRRVFRILEMEKDHQSSSYGGAPMPYTLRLTGDGVSIHGSAVRPGYATHGCIGVPLEFARRLFGQAHKGDQVLILSSSQTI
jgi:lipoprotein-anchoring transpeptidase ErfK/SrfK